MASERVTFSIPASLKKKLRKHRDVNWSGFVAKVIEERLAALELADRLLANSRLTELDAKELAAMVDEAVAKKLGTKK